MREETGSQGNKRVLYAIRECTMPTPTLLQVTSFAESPKNKEAEKVELENWPISSHFKIWRSIFSKVKHLSFPVFRRQAWNRVEKLRKWSGLRTSLPPTRFWQTLIQTLKSFIPRLPVDSETVSQDNSSDKKEKHKLKQDS